MKNKGSLKYLVQSHFGVISGIAYNEEEGIVASFKLQVEENSIHSETDPKNSIRLKMVFKQSGRKAKNVFDEIFAGYEESDCRVVKEGCILSGWTMSRSKAWKAIEEVKEVLRQVAS